MIFTLFVFSCNNEATDKKSDKSTSKLEMKNSQTKKSESMQLFAKNVLPVKTFNLWKENWKNHGGMWMDSTMKVWKGTAHPILTAYNMPKIDLSEVLSEDADSTRFYLGLKALSNGYEAKLMLVGVKAGANMLDTSKNEFAYDLTKSCPPYCEDN